MSNFALQVNVPAIEDGEFDISLIGTGVGMHDPIFTREVLGAKSNQLLRSIQPKLVTRVILPSLHFLHAGNLISHNNRGDAEPICPNRRIRDSPGRMGHRDGITQIPQSRF